MRIAFCITCKGRAHHIERTLPANLADNPTSLFVLLNYGSPDGLMDYLARAHRHDLDTGRLVVYTAPNAGPFRMAHAKNMAHRLAIHEGATVLCNLDADNYTGPDFEKFIGNHFATNGPDTYLWARMIVGKLARGISGRIACTAQTFLKAGGYDEHYENWGPDDKDFNARLQRMGYVPYEIPTFYLRGIRHDEESRFQEYPEARPKILGGTACNEQQIDDSSPNVANNGYFGCGVVRWNFTGQRVTLSPLPTRIFGIGMHKTGTTSLCRALTMLGFDAAHWVSARWARDVWEEMESKGHSPTLERHYAVADLPIPLLYKELDHAYPGSKFILCVRPEQEWADSVAHHWTPANPFRYTWDEDCFTHKVHHLLYGRKTFDRDAMLDRYRLHNAEVRQYFRNRPADLLIMDMKRNSIWPKLCNFLGILAPVEPYPRENVTGPDSLQQRRGGG